MKAVAALTTACAVAAALAVWSGSDASAQGGCLPGDTPVSISGSAYSPGTVQIAVGGTVCWTNNDTLTHTVTSDSPGFDSGNLITGASFRHTFSSAGSFGYHCEVPSHVMAGTVVVGGAPPPPPPPPPLHLLLLRLLLRRRRLRQLRGPSRASLGFACG